MNRENLILYGECLNSDCRKITFFKPIGNMDLPDSMIGEPYEKGSRILWGDYAKNKSPLHNCQHCTATFTEESIRYHNTRKE